jgi:glucose-6-phosphate isomerase
MTNAATARTLGEAAVADHFCAVSTQLDKIAAFGIRSDRVFGFWDWVGGRYSVWSSIGHLLAIGIGKQNFEEFLLGGQGIDTHFVEAPLNRNIPVLMALLGIWYRDFWGIAAHAVIPYDERMARFPAYLQQLEMESNGKSVDLSGKRAK